MEIEETTVQRQLGEPNDREKDSNTSDDLINDDNIFPDPGFLTLQQKLLWPFY
jgi:hypothetical protein